MSVKILITAWNAYPAINPQAGRTVGGMETFAWSIARQLAMSSEFEVHFCVRETRLPREYRVDQVHLESVVEPLRKIRHAVSQELTRSRSFPWVHVRKVDPHLLWQVPLLAAARLMKRRISWAERTRSIVRTVQPDVILALGVNADTAAAVSAGNAEQTPVMVWLQSNTDLEPRFFSLPDFRDVNQVSSAEARICLQQADAIICQTSFQQSQLQSLARRYSTVIRNPVNSVRFHPGESSFDSRTSVLWVGRYDRLHKRPLLAMEAVRKCPEIPFRFVINAGEARVKEELLRNLPPNVTIIDYISNDDMPEAYRASRLFLSTGSQEFEGFPNVFLEAAASGTPICSLEDFDNFLKLSHAGRCTQGNVEQLAASIMSLWHDAAAWKRHSLAGIDYVRREHALNPIVDQLRMEISQLLQKTRLCEQG